MILVGIDPGYRNLGMARLRVAGVGEPVVLCKTARIGAPRGTIPERLPLIFRPTFLDMFGGADRIGAEACPMGFKRATFKQETATLLGIVVGCAATVACELGIPYKSVAAPRLKALCTGSRTGGKEGMMALIERICPGFQGSDHEADAALAALAAWRLDVIKHFADNMAA